MIFKIIAAAEMLFIFYAMVKSIKGEAEQDKKAYSYTQLDSILQDRERTKQLEDLISSSSAYKMGQHEKAIQITYSDIDGTKHTYDTFVSDAALDYFKQESDKNHDRILKKIQNLLKSF